MWHRQVKVFCDSVSHSFYQLVRHHALEYDRYSPIPSTKTFESASNWDRCRRAMLSAVGLYSSPMMTRHFLSRCSFAVVSSCTVLMTPLSSSSLVFPAVGFGSPWVLRRVSGLLDIPIMGGILCQERIYCGMRGFGRCYIVLVIFSSLFRRVGDRGKVEKMFVPWPAVRFHVFSTNWLLKNKALGRKIETLRWFLGLNICGCTYSWISRRGKTMRIRRCGKICSQFTDNLDSYKPNVMAWSEWPWDNLALKFNKEPDLP